jgi:hypothetical protein
MGFSASDQGGHAPIRRRERAVRAALKSYRKSKSYKKFSRGTVFWGLSCHG